MEAQLSSPGNSQHGGDDQNLRKRKRKTFSCNTCRNRKLKCDREVPVCSRCQKSGQASACFYEYPPEPVVSKNKDAGLSIDPGFNSYVSPASGRGVFVSPHQQAERIAALESRIGRYEPGPLIGEYHNKRFKVDHDTNIEPSFQDGSRQVSTSLYGSGFRTGFFGPSSERNAASYYPAILKLYPNLSPFVQFNNLQHPLFGQVRTHIWTIRKNAKIAKKMLKPSPALSPLHALADKDVAIMLVTEYWSSIAPIHHIFHGPTFWASFWSYWEETSQQTEAMACIILLMMACVNVSEQHRHPPAKYRGLSNASREQAAYWIETCDVWMSRQSRKHLTIESYQSRVLLAIAKQINAIKRKQLWERSGELLAFAISTGLHQDLSKIDTTSVRDTIQNQPTKPKCTPYEQEMRRRLWAAIVELELQASLDKGVPPSRLALMADCGHPTHLADEQFEPTSSVLPTPKPTTTFTISSYLHLSQRTYRLRASLTELVNTNASLLSYDDILAYDEQIKDAIRDMPSWSRSSDIAAAVPSALLELQLLQLQLLLHMPCARGTDKSPRANLSRMSCIETGDRMLRIHTTLAELPKTRQHKYAAHWLSLTREDLFRAIVGVCFNLVIWRGLNSEVTAITMKEVYVERAQIGFELFKRKVLDLGDYYVQLWYTMASIGMLKASFDIENVDSYVIKLTNELTNLFSEVAATQEEPSNEHTAASTLTALATPNSGAFDGGVGTTPLPLPDFGTTSGFLDGSDLNAFGFDEMMWPFNNTGLSW